MLIITNKFLKLKATITGGDIWKSLAKGIILEDKINLVMYPNPKYINIKTHYNEIKNWFVQRSDLHKYTLSYFTK